MTLLYLVAVCLLCGCLVDIARLLHTCEDASELSVEISAWAVLVLSDWWRSGYRAKATSVQDFTQDRYSDVHDLLQARSLVSWATAGTLLVSQVLWARQSLYIAWAAVR
jgi:hypothetical protein